MPLGQLWPTEPLYSLYTAYIQPIYSLYTAYIQPIYTVCHDCASSTGESFGQYTLIRDRTWGAEDGMLCEYVAAELTEIRSISVDVFENALKMFPEFEREFQILEDHHASERYPQYLLDDAALQVSRWGRLMQAITEREKAFWSSFRNGLSLQHVNRCTGQAVAGSVQGGFVQLPPTPQDGRAPFCALSLPLRSPFCARSLPLCAPALPPLL